MVSPFGRLAPARVRLSPPPPERDQAGGDQAAPDHDEALFDDPRGHPRSHLRRPRRGLRLPVAHGDKPSLKASDHLRSPSRTAGGQGVLEDQRNRGPRVDRTANRLIHVRSWVTQRRDELADQTDDLVLLHEGQIAPHGPAQAETNLLVR